MEVEVNMWAVLLAAVSSMVVGSIWYTPKVFGDTWRKFVKIDDKRMKTEAPKAMGMAFVLSLVMAYILAHFIYLASRFYADRSFLSVALTTSLFSWVGFMLAITLTHDAFEQRRKKLSLLNVGNMLATIMAMGLIIGLMGV